MGGWVGGDWRTENGPSSERCKALCYTDHIGPKLAVRGHLLTLSPASPRLAHKAPYGGRTHDHTLTERMLCQLS